MKKYFSALNKFSEKKVGQKVGQKSGATLGQKVGQLFSIDK